MHKFNLLKTIIGDRVQEVRKYRKGLDHMAKNFPQVIDAMVKRMKPILSGRGKALASVEGSGAQITENTGYEPGGRPIMKKVNGKVVCVGVAERPYQTPKQKFVSTWLRNRKKVTNGR